MRKAANETKLHATMKNTSFNEMYTFTKFHLQQAMKKCISHELRVTGNKAGSYPGIRSKIL
jgi:hypothetical protein